MAVINLVYDFTFVNVYFISLTFNALVKNINGHILERWKVTEWPSTPSPSFCAGSLLHRPGSVIFFIIVCTSGLEGRGRGTFIFFLNCWRFFHLRSNGEKRPNYLKNQFGLFFIFLDIKVYLFSCDICEENFNERCAENSTFPTMF